MEEKSSKRLSFLKRVLRSDSAIAEPVPKKRRYLECEKCTKAYFYTYLGAILVNRLSFISVPELSMNLSGGFEFMMTYLVFYFITCVPITLIEASIGQMTGFTVIQLFSFSRFFKGLGITFFMTSIFRAIFVGLESAVCFLYLMESFFRKKLPWGTCSNFFNSKHCVNSSFIFRSNGSLSSALEFFQYKISGNKNKFEQTTFDFMKSEFKINYYVILYLFLAYILILPCFLEKRRIRMVYILFCLIVSIICLVQLLIFSVNLPGSHHGVKRFFNSSFSVKNVFNNAGKLCYVSFYMSGIISASAATIASQNSINFNFNRAVIMVFFSQCIFTFLTSLLVFLLIGNKFAHFDLFLAEDKTFSKSDVISWVFLIDCLSNKRYWTIVYILWNFVLCLDDLIINVEVIYLALSSAFPICETKYTYFLRYLALCGILFFMSATFCNSWNPYMEFVIFSHLYNLSYPVSIFLTFFLLLYVYGVKQVKIDYKVMIRSTFSWYWLFGIFLSIPIFFSSLTMGEFWTTIRVNIGLEFLSYVIALAFLFPIVFVAAKTVSRAYYSKSIHGIHGYMEYFFKPPTYWGPRLKRYWLKSHFYSKKLKKVFNDDEFVLSLKGSENLVPTLIVLKKSSSSKRSLPKVQKEVSNIDSKYW